MATNHPKWKVLIVLLLISILSFLRLVRPGYFSMQDDVQTFRLFELDKCVKTLQIPCRWIPDGGAGYGYPLFNYYPPLPYALGEVFHLTGVSVIDSVKLLFISGFLLSSFAMFFLASSVWGEAIGFLSAAFYLYAPYRSVDSFVRGDLSEFFGLGIAPLVLLGIYRVASRKKWGWVIFVISLSCLLLTHLLSLLMLLPLAAVWTVYWLWRQRETASLKTLASGSFLSLGLAAFSWLPALAEKNLVTLNTITTGYFDYRGHFASLSQLFISRFWGYGASLFQRSDLSLSIGQLQWMVPVAFALAAIFFRKKKIIKDAFFSAAIFLGFFYAFMAHNQSTPVWQAIPFLAYLQFPWRFVGFSVLSFTLALSTLNLKSRWLIALLIMAVIFVNIGFFREDIWYPSMTDSLKFSSRELAIQNISGLKDYWPDFGTRFPDHQAPALPSFIDGFGSIQSAIRGTNKISYTIEAKVASTMEFPVVYFPNWVVVSGDSGRELPLRLTQPLGLISVDLPKGRANLRLELLDTPIRILANFISLISTAMFLFFLSKAIRKRSTNV